MYRVCYEQTFITNLNYNYIVVRPKLRICNVSIFTPISSISISLISISLSIREFWLITKKKNRWYFYIFLYFLFFTILIWLLHVNTRKQLSKSSEFLFIYHFYDGFSNLAIIFFDFVPSPHGDFWSYFFKFQFSGDYQGGIQVFFFRFHFFPLKGILGISFFLIELATFQVKLIYELVNYIIGITNQPNKFHGT